MKKFFLAIAIFVSLTSFLKPDKEPPVISGAHIYYNSLGDYAVMSADVTDNVGVFQVIFQIDPCGPTYPAGAKMDRNCSYWGATDFWGNNTFTPDDLDLEPGTHTLRITAYDRARNETQVEIDFFVD